jgi:hypothetical protein
MLNRSREFRFAAGESYDVVDEFAADALTARGETMPEFDEIETLRMLAGHLPRRLSQSTSSVSRSLLLWDCAQTSRTASLGRDFGALK